MGAGGISHLVDICNVDHAVAVLKELGHLGDLRLADGNNLVEDFGVQVADDLHGGRCESRKNLGDLLGCGEATTRVDTLRRHATVKDVLVRAKNLASGSDLNARLDDDRVTRLDMLEHHGESIDQVSEIDRVVSLEEGGHGDQVVSDSVEHGLIAGNGDLLVWGKDWAEFCQTLWGHVKADGVVNAAKLLEESLADKTNTDNCNQSAVREILVLKSGHKRVLALNALLSVDDNHVEEW